MEKNQLEPRTGAQVRRQAGRRRRHRAQDRVPLDDWIAAARSAEQALAEQARRVPQLAGLGATNAATVRAEVPERGTVGDRQIAPLFGVAQ